MDCFVNLVSWGKRSGGGGGGGGGAGIALKRVYSGTTCTCLSGFNY